MYIRIYVCMNSLGMDPSLDDMTWTLSNCIVSHIYVLYAISSLEQKSEATSTDIRTCALFGYTWRFVGVYMYCTEGYRQWNDSFGGMYRNESTCDPARNYPRTRQLRKTAVNPSGVLELLVRGF